MQVLVFNSWYLQSCMHFLSTGRVQTQVENRLKVQVFVIKVPVKAVTKLWCSFNEVLILNFWQHVPQISTLIASSGEEQCSDKHWATRELPDCTVVLIWKSAVQSVCHGTLSSTTPWPAQLSADLVRFTLPPPSLWHPQHVNASSCCHHA